MPLSNLQVFDELIIPTAVELLSQRIELFNASSRGALTLSASDFAGDFLQERLFRDLSGAIRRVDMNVPNADPPKTDLTQVKRTAVKVAGAFGPVIFEPIALEWTKNPTGEQVVRNAGHLADGLLYDMVNTAIAALVAALNNNPNARFDASPNPITLAAQNSSHALFGDRSSAIITSVMTGMAYHKLIGQNLANAANLFVAGNVRVVDILGRAVVVTDAPALSVAGSPGRDYVLGLTDGAAVVTNAGSNIITNIETSNKIRIEHSLQFDYNFGLGIKGYTWNEAISSPSDAQLRTGTNWTQVTTSVKDTAGVLAIGQAA
jgi:hypothetical protein